MNVLCIHGAFSSPTVFNYIISQNTQINWSSFSYASRFHGVKSIIDDINKFLDNIHEPTMLIGHSLGGVIGANLLTHTNVSGLITISSPIKGIRMPYASKWFMQKTFVQEITPSSKPISNAKKNLDNTSKKVYNIVTVEGFNPFMMEMNDGVVTVNSQVYGPHEKFYVEANHHEILQHNETINIIKNL